MSSAKLAEPLRHPWNLSPKEAVQLQREIAAQVCLRDDFGKIQTVAGSDISIHPNRKEGWAGVLLYEFPSLNEIERVYYRGPLSFPYVPGLLSFREAPLLVEAFAKLKRKPDLVMIDGQGIAHPRRLGIASHMGLLLQLPTIGCAKSRLCGQFQEPGWERGESSPLLDRGEKVGAVLRSKTGVRPLFISTGHRVSLKTAIRLVLDCGEGYRVPKPTREADRYVAQLKQSLAT